MGLQLQIRDQSNLQYTVWEVVRAALALSAHLAALCALLLAKARAPLVFWVFRFDGSLGAINLRNVNSKIL